jgi:hypothetical protein
VDADFLSAFHELPIRRRSELESALSELLVRGSGGRPLTVKGARDHFSAVNRSVKSGQIQVVGGSPDDQTVLLSVRDLATMIQAAASQLTFGAALAASGFEPAAHRILLGEGFEAEDNFLIDGAFEKVEAESAAESP